MSSTQKKSLLDDIVDTQVAYLTLRLSEKERDRAGDLPGWMVKLSRAIVRDCVAPGKYRVEFTIESDKKRIKTAVIMRVEDIRVIDHLF